MSDGSTTETQTQDINQRGREDKPLEVKKEVRQMRKDGDGGVVKAEPAEATATSNGDKAKNTLIWIIKNLDKKHTDTLLKSKQQQQNVNNITI